MSKFLLDKMYPHQRMIMRIPPTDAMILAGLSTFAAVARENMGHEQPVVTNTAKPRLDDDV